MARLARIIGVLACQTDAAVAVREHSQAQMASRFQLDSKLSALASAESSATLQAVTESLFSEAAHDLPRVTKGALDTIASQMDVKTAVQAMSQQELPRDVSGLIQKVGGQGGGDFAQPFDEDSLDKARRALNDLIEKAWIELDDKIFKCKGFEDMNRNNYGQVVRDIMRLIEQINDLERQEAEAVAGIAEKNQQIRDVEELLEQEEKLYLEERRYNEGRLRIMQNDLDVFEFILTYTACKKETFLSQMDMKVCQMHSGRSTFLFGDHKVAGKYKKLLSKTSKKNIDKVLSELEGTAFVQFAVAPNNLTTPPPMIDEPVLGEDGKPCIAATGQVEGNAADEAGQQGYSASQEDGTPGSGMGDEDECMKSCSPEPPKCWLLHDKLSLMWGKYKDQVDELTMIMQKNDYEWFLLKMNLNNQIRILTAAKSRLEQLLAEVRSNLAADRQELKEKQNQKRKLDQQYNAYMTLCFRRIQWIMYQDMCAIKVVRNAVLENSTTCDPQKFQDCDVDSWVKGKCSVPCDDKCNPNNYFECGGWAVMNRAIIEQEDECGIKCPVTTKTIRCGQFKCPVDCVMSEWSGWGACSAECEGGVRSRTRSIHQKPKNGGEFCDSTEETEPCNTQTCTRDCTLNRWTEWTPCSVACEGGFQERKKHILIPIRGEGKCPKEMSNMRYGRRTCNTQKCIGDEICIAKQDLVVAVDGSGSVTQQGFDILVKFTSTLLARYQTQYYGEEAMKVGLCQFGTGEIMNDGRGKTFVAPAINVKGLTTDLDGVLTAVGDLKFKKGFTNMAQAFSMAERMFILGSRKSAQQSVLTITDGKPSFAWMTNEMVEQLDDKGIMRYFVVVNNQGPTSDVMKQMKDWASQPWETNLIHIEGILVLASDYDMWAQKALVKFCPNAFSPSTESHWEAVLGYAHVKDSAWCGDFVEENTLSASVQDADQCASLVQGAGGHCFFLGTFFLRGTCVKCSLTAAQVDRTQYDKWLGAKKNPLCEVGQGWHSSMFYDFYAMEPAA